MNWVQRQMEKKRNEEGFTLIELLIVIIILGILAAVVIFAIGAVTDKGQLASCRTDAKTLRTAEEAVFNEKGGYKDEAGLVASKSITELSEYHIVDAQTGTTGKSDAATSDYKAFTVVAEGKCLKVATPAGGGTCVAPDKCYTP